MSEALKNDITAKDGGPVDLFDALALLYLQKQDLVGLSPEEIVGKFIETHDRVKKEFAHQKEVRKRRLNPLPL